MELNFFSTQIELFFILGIVAGLLSGILGIGGAFVLVPGLIYIFEHYYSFDPSFSMRLILGTTMTCMIFNAVSSSFYYKKANLINIEYVKKNVWIIILSTCIGVFLTQFFSSSVMKMVFAAFCCYSGFNMVLRKKQQSLLKPNKMIVSLFGALCGFIGVGGASLFVSYFNNAEKMEFRESIGTSAAFQVPIAIVGSLSYLVLGLTTQTQQIDNVIGYIYVPAFLIISITAAIFVKIGVIISTKIPSAQLKKIFGIFTILIGLNMAAKVFL